MSGKKLITQTEMTCPRDIVEEGECGRDPMKDVESGFSCLHLSPGCEQFYLCIRVNCLVIHLWYAHWQFFVRGCVGKKPIIGEQSSCDVVKTCILLILFFRLVSRLFCFYGWFLSKAERIPQRIAKTVWMILILKIHALTQKFLKVIRILKQNKLITETGRRQGHFSTL